MTTPIKYEEQQRFSPLVLVFMLGTLGIIALLVLLDDEADQVTVLSILGAVAAAMALLWRTATLNIRVDRTGLHLKTLYFVSRSIAFADIHEAKAVTYRPLRDYGGWGYRISSRGRAFNMRGNKGLQLVLADGQQLLVGSQQADKLSARVHAYLAADADTAA